MDIFLIILGVLCLLAGLAGCFLPVLPGPPVSYVGLLLLHFTDKIHFSTTHLILWAFLVIIVQVMDYVTPMLGTKYSGGGKWGNRGCMIVIPGKDHPLGLHFAGLFVFPPWGVLIGPFAGAVIGELFGGKKSAEAFKAGLGAFVGFLFSVVVKVSVCGYFIYSFVAALF